MHVLCRVVTENMQVPIIETQHRLTNIDACILGRVTNAKTRLCRRLSKPMQNHPAM